MHEDITPCEQAVLDFLLSVHPRIVDRFQVFRHLNALPEDHPVTVRESAVVCQHISNMRRKLRYYKIINLYKYGYRIDLIHAAKTQ